MPDYIKWKMTGHISQLSTQEARDFIKRKFDEVDAHNQQLYNALVEKDSKIGALLIEVYGERSKQYAYWRKQIVPKPKTHHRVYKKLLQDYWKWQEAEDRREKQRGYYRRRNEARALLEANGYVYGEHFGGNAISFAREVLIEVEPGVYGNRMLPSGEDTP